MKINKIEIKAKKFAYDGCHKIYILKNEEEEKEAVKLGYKINEIEELEKIYKNSCYLKFIDSWDLSQIFVAQGETAIFEK